MSIPDKNVNFLWFFPHFLKMKIKSWNKIRKMHNENQTPAGDMRQTFVFFLALPQLTAILQKKRGKVYFKSQILVHAYWTILDHFPVPVLFVSGFHQHVPKNVNITFTGNTGTPEMFQYSPILGCSSIWDVKYTFIENGFVSFGMHWKGMGILQMWTFLDKDKNIQKIIKKAIRIFEPFSVVKFECLDQFW